ncbi:adenylyl-sulfate kinase [Buchnera aphidicola (Mollitrichosiphum nigrofasciatum)]|uniref:adenylyl-sulfate kinase n=1 Tax=Buchnera aphidicola TaxID=9 RepID=UPI0031B86C6D
MTSNIFWSNNFINRNLREIHHKHNSLVLWFTGLSGSGKSTIANIVEQELYKLNIITYLLDGDNVRHGLCKDLNFKKKDRKENIRRISEVVKLFLDSGIVVLVTCISPYLKNRALAKKIIGLENFYEIFIDTPLSVCQLRDPKGLYKKASNGNIKNFTGINDIYEIPIKPYIHINGQDDLQKNVQNIICSIKAKIF